MGYTLSISCGLLGGVSLFYFALSTYKRTQSMKLAKKAIREDEQTYNARWNLLLAAEHQAVSSLALFAFDIRSALPQTVVRQTYNSLDVLFADAHEINTNFQAALESIAHQTGGLHKRAPVKR